MTAIAGLVHQERTRWDPKDGELCLARAKPGIVHHLSGPNVYALGAPDRQLQS